MQTETLRSPSTKEQACPNCQHAIVVHQGFVAWCEHCGWNVQPQKPETNAQSHASKLYDQMYEKMGKRFGRILYEQVVKEQAVKPKLGLNRMLVLLLSLPVHVINIVLALYGIYSLVIGWPHVYSLFWGVICLALAWMMRPHLGKLPKKMLSRAEFPTLYRIIDDISALFDTTSVAGIVVDADFNASFRQVGWRRKKVIQLGLPLLSTLDAEETIALLSHEIAHGVNGDSNRGFVSGNAMRMLGDWYSLLEPVRGRRARGLVFLAAFVGHVALTVLRAMINAYAYLLVHLSWRDSQRAEYLADSLAAEASGTKAVIRLLDKLHLSGIYAYTIQKSYLNQKDSPFFAELSHQVNTIPASEWERIRRVEKLEDSRLDATHPQTAYRIGFMETRQVEIPKYVLTAQDVEQLAKELAPLQKQVEQKIIEMYKRSLYK